tara:strand:+ start:1287 stop:2009 length:723 start_codon:yes stop_codon:yes gene_type:complete
MDIKERILLALGLNKAEEQIKLEWQSKSEDGGTIYVSTAEELAEGVDVSVLTEDGTTIPLPIGTYKTDTGVSFRVDVEGVVGAVLETESEEAETPKEEVEEVEAGEDRGEDDDEVAVDDWEGMEKRIKNLEDAIADIKSRLGEDDGEEESEEEELSEEVSEPSKNPRTKTTKTTETIEFSAEDEIKKLKAENEKLKTELAASPAEAPINTNKFSSERAAVSKRQYNRMTKQERFLYNLNK